MRRATLYFKALRLVHDLLAKTGFQDEIPPSHTAWSMGLGGFNLEAAVVNPGNVVHVTSYPGYVYNPDEVTAKVERCDIADPGEYTVRLIGLDPRGRSTVPVFVVINKDSPEPLREAVMTMLFAIENMLKTRPEILERMKLERNQIISQSWSESG
jgi:hypothetical protein